jgi:hypothetical protein
MSANKIKFLLKITFFSIGVLLFGMGGYGMFLVMEGLGENKLQDISIGQSFATLLFLVGVYITTTLLKGKTVTKQETDEQKEIFRRDKNNGN